MSTKKDQPIAMTEQAESLSQIKPKRVISDKELQQHNTGESLWVVVYGKVFDLTDFYMDHSGGWDIIEEYANFGSTVYAPITRDGLSLDKKANKYEVQPEALSSYQGIEELSRSLPAKVFQSKISVDKFKFNFQSKLSRREVSHKAQLNKAKASIEAQLV